VAKLRPLRYIGLYLVMVEISSTATLGRNKHNIRNRVLIKEQERSIEP
jgi:hypothetical protein